MCGFTISKLGRGNSRFIRRRGPDAYGSLSRDGLLFEHFLLHVTGDLVTQPYIDGDVVMVYNGEIYNTKFTHSDGECIIPLYQEYGAGFPVRLDGEFAIALYDFAAGLAYFVTDRFATKPLWRDGIECASYQSGIGGHKVEANTVEVVRLDTEETVCVSSYHEWDWFQYLRSYDECLEAFSAAVRKRWAPQCFIGLSSGYDSGALACALSGCGEFKAYSVLASESQQIIASRASRLPDVQVIEAFDIGMQRQHLAQNAEEFRYAIRYDDGPGTGSYRSDYASLALSHICMLASGEGRKVLLSGAGADEILSDYSLIPRQSEFKGKFPRQLRPWANFTGSCMYSYLGKEELVGGSWGIETRYPYLDTDFVQAFLNLKPELKNRHYKAPLYEYLTQQGYPFEPNRKIGFSPRAKEVV